MRLPTLVASLVVTVLAGAVLVGCSSSGGGGGSTSGPAGTSAATAPGTAGAATSGASASTGLSVTTGAPTPTGSVAASAAKVCSDLSKVGQQISQLTAQASNPASLKEALVSAGQFLSTLRAEAPTALQPVLNDLGTLFQTAQKAVANPQKPDLSALAGLLTKLPTDTKKINDWVKANCTSS